MLYIGNYPMSAYQIDNYLKALEIMKRNDRLDMNKYKEKIDNNKYEKDKGASAQSN